MRIKSIIIILVSVVALLSLSSCGSPKAVATAAPAAPESHYGQEVSEPFSGPEYKSDSSWFRIVGQGTSPDASTAKKIAALNARTSLATSVGSVVKAVTEQYINQVSIADTQEYASKFEETARSIVNQELQNVTVKDEKVFSKGGKYTAFVAIEMPRAALEQSIEDAISKDEKMGLEFDKFQFQKTFDAEMAKFEETN